MDECSQCGDSIKENNIIMESVKDVPAKSRDFIIKTYYQESRKICMMCFTKIVIMFQRIESEGRPK